MKFQTYQTQWTILEPDYYTATITDAKEVENSFYDPEKPKDGFPTQLEVDFAIDDPTDEKNPAVHVKKWFTPVLTGKSGLTQLLKALYPTFDLKNPKEEELETDKWLLHDVRVNITQKEDKKGITRNKITDILPVKKA